MGQPVEKRGRWFRSIGCAAALAAMMASPTAAVEPQPTTSGGAQAELLSRLSLTSQHGPVKISAKELEFDYRTRTLTYRGSVVVSQADLTLNSDALRIILDEQAREVVREVTAEGHVRIEQGKRVATGGRAVFDQGRRTVVLSDNAVLREGPNEVAGERVVIYLDEQRSVVEGGNQRVRAVLYPQQLEKHIDTTAAQDDHGK
jgi:lipopolysaccharide export system protein LptA